MINGNTEIIAHIGFSTHAFKAPISIEELDPAHSDELADLVLRLDKIGYRGDYSYEVFNDDYQQLPLNVVAQRAVAQ